MRKASIKPHAMFVNESTKWPVALSENAGLKDITSVANTTALGVALIISR